jgi:UDP-N-acetylglucosamine diphosphorylase/glucosamine-1-phosphate N-acetyltransferase
MNQIVLFDGSARANLLPFTFTRPVADIRIGILKISEKWEKYIQLPVAFKTEEYLQEVFPLRLQSENLFINASYLPNPKFVKQLMEMPLNTVLKDKEEIVAYIAASPKTNFSDALEIPLELPVITVKNTWNIFANNQEAIKADFELLTQNRISQVIPNEVFVVNRDQIFVEEGAKLYNGSLNASEGPIYIGKDAEIMENCSVRGPFSLGEGSSLKMGSKIYKGTTIGPHSKIGGEVSNSVIFGYSNKGHDGFLGNSVLGEWCNLGADTNTSNLKNNYAKVRLWDYFSGRFADTGLQFCGLMMGDHSKCGINTMFNTGTVVGVSANIFGAGFPRNFIPSFSWGGSAGTMTYTTEKAFEVATVVMQRRGLQLTEADQNILLNVFEQTKKFRKD